MATFSEVDICNLALSRIHHRRQITSLTTDTSEAAKACNRAYAHCRDTLLTEVDWNFARMRAVLTEASFTTFTIPEHWQYAYLLPDGMLQPRFVDDSRQVRFPEQNIRYRIERVSDSPGLGDVLVLFTDEQSASLIYTHQVTTTSEYPPYFVDYLAARIANEVAFAITGDPQVAQVAVQLEDRYGGIAKALNLDQQQEGYEPISEFVQEFGGIWRRRTNPGEQGTAYWSMWS